MIRKTNNQSHVIRITFGCLGHILPMVLLLGTSMPSSARATTRYVGPSETYTTIQAAIAEADTHDIVIVMDG